MRAGGQRRTSVRTAARSRRAVPAGTWLRVWAAAGDGPTVVSPSRSSEAYLYGYFNKMQSSRRLEREAQRNVELMWLTRCMAPDFKTIADFRRGSWRCDSQ